MILQQRRCYVRARNAEATSAQAAAAHWGGTSLFAQLNPKYECFTLPEMPLTYAQLPVVRAGRIHVKIAAVF